MSRRTRLCFEACGLTDQGLQRESNQDSFIVRPDLGLLVVADGLGRSPAGALAAALAVREVERSFEHARPRDAQAHETTSAVRGRLVRAFARADRRVFEAGQRHPQHKGMLTTLAAVVIVRDRVVVAHLGDSRVYRLHGPDVDRRRLKPVWSDPVSERLTRDHNGLEDPERPRPAEADRGRPELQLLTRVIGRGEARRVPTRIVRVEPDDTLLVCTDGLHGVLLQEDFELPLRYLAGLRRAKDPERKRALPQVQCAWMVDRVKDRKAPDNVTVIVARMRKGRGRWRTERAIGCVVHAPPPQPWRVAPRPQEENDEDEDGE